MTPAEFVAKWARSELREKQAYQQHFLDLCELVEHPKPAEVDWSGESFCFEKGASKHGGGDGWADVWKRNCFGWEYKGKDKDLDAAYDQLLKYREALESPPLLVVSDFERIVIRTNFTGTKTEVHEITLADLPAPRNLEILRHLFHSPEKLKPGATSETITAEAAEKVAEIAQSLRARGLDPQIVARFLDRVVFCLFAEDVRLLPNRVFARILEKGRHQPDRFVKLCEDLFAAMAAGGDFGADEIRRFNGDLFAEATALDLTFQDLDALHAAAKLDWSAVDPSIFGTLFERGLDPDKRSQLGAHYTSREDIETLVEPVVMQPLRREFEETKRLVENLLASGKKEPTGKEKALSDAGYRKARTEGVAIVRRFLERLANVTVLDPACGSGNFLYVTLQKLKDLEKEAILFAQDRLHESFLPYVSPLQLYGIEINRYAYELAQMTVWIGYLQWIRDNGFGVTDDPVLRPMHNFECKDAILDLTDAEYPKEPEWPKVDFIVGNPPFLGDKLMRRQLGDGYVDALRELFDGRLPGQADLCCYWFEKARQQIQVGKCLRAGLLATQGIRGGASREALKRIKESGDIFFAVSDREWVLEGANVHVSLVGFDAGEQTARVLDGQPVTDILVSLTAHANIASAGPLEANSGLGFIGVAQKAPFDIPEPTAITWSKLPNPNGRPNSDVLRPVVNASDVTRRPRGVWNIDFGVETPAAEAALYEEPFMHVDTVVRPLRVGHRERVQAKRWWLFARTSPDMRAALAGLPRFAVTPRVSKHRVFSWRTPEAICDSAVVAFARSDDYFFGVLHSHLHEIWARAQGTQLRERESGFRYTPTTCFETFPFPYPENSQQIAIATAARELDALRANWLNPPEWVKEEILEFPGSLDGPWKRYVVDPDARGIGTVRYPRLVPRDADCAAKLAERTLTKLYNQRPTWLANLHAKLDETIFAAYGWPADLSDEQILERLLALNLERAAVEQAAGRAPR